MKILYGESLGNCHPLQYDMQKEEIQPHEMDVANQRIKYPNPKNHRSSHNWKTIEC